MTKGRLEAFSDGVLAIIITIMVLELKVPHETTITALLHVAPVFFSYVISFIYVAIYWGNHHHLLQTTHHVNGKIIWANMLLLFCLSLLPFTSGWMGENNFDKLPMGLYSFNLLACAMAFYLLQYTIDARHTHSTRLMQAIQKQKTKGIISAGIYLLATGMSFYMPMLSVALVIIPAILWMYPDKNIEAAMQAQSHEE